MKSQKIILIVVLLVVFLGAGLLIWQPEKEKPLPDFEEKKANDPFNLVYFIEGEEIVLRDGRAETETAPGAAAKKITAVWQNQSAGGDLDGNGSEDWALVLTHELGGSGVFYYVVAALKDPVSGQFQGTNGFFLGDRIQPQAWVIEDNILEVNYLERRAGEPMATPPSLETTVFLVVENGFLQEKKPTEPIVSAEENCLKTGGLVTVASCCLSVEDFPNLCPIGACGCSPDNSHEIKICDCGEEKCFDGEKCVVRE